MCVCVCVVPCARVTAACTYMHMLGNCPNYTSIVSIRFMLIYVLLWVA